MCISLYNANNNNNNNNEGLAVKKNSQDKKVCMYIT